MSTDIITRPGVVAGGPRVSARALAERFAVPLVLLAAIAYMALYAPFALTWPPVSSDEGREMNAFWVGAGVDPAAQLLDPFYGRDPLYKGGVQGLSVSLAFRAFGLDLGLARLVSSAWAVLLLLATFLAGRALFGLGAAAIATALLAASQPFLYSAHFVRPDIVVAALVMLALWLALAPPGRWFAHLAAGLLLGLAVDVHPYAVACIPLVGAASACSAGRSTPRALTWLALGLALGAAWYLGSRVIPDPARYSESVGFWVGVDKRPPLLTEGPLAMLWGELGRFRDYYADRLPELAIVLLGLAWGVWAALRGKRAALAVVLGLLGLYLLFSGLAASKVPFYLVVYQPPLQLLVGGALAAALHWSPRRFLVGTLATALLALFGFGLLGYVRDLGYRYQSGDHAYPALGAHLRAAIPPGAVVVGQPRYWPALSEYRFVDITVADRLRQEQGMSFREFVQRSGATVVLMDSDTRTDMPRADRAWLNDHSTKPTVLTQKYYDTIDVRLLTGAP